MRSISTRLYNLLREDDPAIIQAFLKVLSDPVKYSDEVTRYQLEFADVFGEYVSLFNLIDVRDMLVFHLREGKLDEIGIGINALQEEFGKITEKFHLDKYYDDEQLKTILKGLVDKCNI